MKLTLKDYQQDAVENLVRQCRKASTECREAGQVVMLSAPTGAGKTVIATAAIERILNGDETTTPDPAATFLWLSDQPQLNEQSRRKLLDASSLLNEDDLCVIDSNLDEPVLKCGRVYFLNTQRIGKDKLLVSHGDKRKNTLWEMVQNTVLERPNSFYLIIDEAHRGMTNGDEDETKRTIVQKFIKGSPGEIGPVPVILGISATPERFQALVQASTRVFRPIEIPTESVRASGLLKDKIRLFHPDDANEGDMTLLRSAAEALATFTSEWADYCKSEGEAVFEPILVVQVEDATKTSISATDIKTAIETINSAIGPLEPDAFAHSFQEQTEQKFGSHTVRYIAPPDITSDNSVRVVFFKTSLNTGWDCPRAEVMMSFRKAVDATNIAQLVGRLVRTPLARRIDKNPFLNSVVLYLPRYDSKGLQSVIKRLTSPDENLPPVEIEEGVEVEILQRAPKSDAAFKALETVLSCVIPKARKSSGIRRMMKCARLLANDGLCSSAIEDAKTLIFEILDETLTVIAKDSSYKQLVEQQAKIKVRAVDWFLTGEVAGSDEAEVILTPENLDERFESVGRRLGEGFHRGWLKHKVPPPSEDTTQAKKELIAACIVGDPFARLESAAQDQVQKWLAEYKVKIRKLPEAARQAYEEIWELAPKIEWRTLSFPNSIEAKKNDATWEKHIFINSDNKLPAAFNAWESAVISKEIKDENVIFWLRNVPRQKWALTIDYEDRGEVLSLYPDFLVIRRSADELVIDILDPHLEKFADAPAKARGLAKYAAMYGLMFGRIQIIRLKDDRIQRLDLTDEKVRNAVLGVSNSEHLRQLFEVHCRE